MELTFYLSVSKAINVPKNEVHPSVISTLFYCNIYVFFLLLSFLNIFFS